MKNYFIFVILLISTQTLGQSLDTISIAKKVIDKYESLLHKLYELKTSNSSKLTTSTHKILCESSSVSNPFVNLYENGKGTELRCKNPSQSYLFYPDCKKVAYYRSIPEYFAQVFVHSDSRVKPQIKDVCVIKSTPGIISVRYSSKGELVTSNCISTWVQRIATINVEVGIFSITELRFAKLHEINAPCIESVSSLETGPLIALSPKPEIFEDLSSDLRETKKKLSELDRRLIATKNDLYRSKTKIDSLSILLNSKSDSISDLKIFLEYEKTQHDNLLNDYKILEDEYFLYKENVLQELDLIAHDLGLFDRQLQWYGDKIKNTIKSYEKFDISNTTFLALNYGLVQSPYNFPNESNEIFDPVKNSFHKEDLSRNFGVAIYRPNIGFHLSNLRIRYKKAPSNNYSSLDFDDAKENLFLQNIQFKDLIYHSSGHNLKTINFGLSFYLLEILGIKPTYKQSKIDTVNTYRNENQVPQIPIINSIYLMLGVSYIHGDIWHYYDGYFPGNFLVDQRTNFYVLDKTKLNKTGLTLGLTYLKPFFQFELGYNTLYNDFYINLGANLPIEKSAEPNRKGGSNQPHSDKNIQRMKEDNDKLRRYINKQKERLQNLD